MSSGTGALSSLLISFHVVMRSFRRPLGIFTSRSESGSINSRMTECTSFRRSASGWFGKSRAARQKARFSSENSFAMCASMCSEASVSIACRTGPRGERCDVSIITLPLSTTRSA